MSTPEPAGRGSSPMWMAAVARAIRCCHELTASAPHRLLQPVRRVCHARHPERVTDAQPGCQDVIRSVGGRGCAQVKRRNIVTDDGAAPTAPAVALDAEGKRLQLQAEKAKYSEAIAKSEQAAAQARMLSLASLVPAVADAPKGEVTVGEKAGALGWWRAHVLVDAVAAKLAAAVKEKLPLPVDGVPIRVLVVPDRSLLQGDWT